MNAPRLIVGLGNPGPEYEATRHNVGFWFVDQLVDKLKVSLAPQAKFFGRAARAGETWLLQPTTFKNRSGQAVAALQGQGGFADPGFSHEGSSSSGFRSAPWR